MVPRVLPLALIAIAAPVTAQNCPDATRLHGHLSYGEAPEADLVAAPSGYAVGQRCLLRSDAMPDLVRLIDASRTDPRTGGQLYALSCFRSIARQTSVFGRERPGGGDADRAASVAPPAFSEHGTGYALDFAIRPMNGCPDADACMAATAPARWLRANATRFGFELSFPGGNRQQVKWEPWHWRWVGTSGASPAAARARAVFACARAAFPADPGIVPVTISVATQPMPPVAPSPPPASPRQERRR